MCKVKKGAQGNFNMNLKGNINPQQLMQILKMMMSVMSGGALGGLGCCRGQGRGGCQPCGPQGPRCPFAQGRNPNFGAGGGVNGSLRFKGPGFKIALNFGGGAGLGAAGGHVPQGGFGVGGGFNFQMGMRAFMGFV